MSPRARSCEVCDVTYQPTYNKQRTCGRACGVELKFRTGTGGVRRQPRPACRPRAAQPASAANCLHCPAPTAGDTAFCSQLCMSAHLDGLRRPVMAKRSLLRACGSCGNTFSPDHGSRIYCSRTCARRAEGRNHRDRARKYGVRYERVSSRYIYQRDRWRCGICTKAIKQGHVYPHLMSPSLDHIVPMSQGGDHVVANLQAAHWLCNALKSDGMTARGEQLLLFG